MHPRLLTSGVITPIVGTSREPHRNVYPNLFMCIDLSCWLVVIMRFVHVCKNGLLVRFLWPMHVDLMHMGGGFFALKLYFHMAYSFS